MSTIGRDYFSEIAEGFTPSVTAGLLSITPSLVVPTDAVQGAIFVAPATGVNFNFTATFAGTYAVGDEITLTVSSNDRSVQKWNKAYKHVVAAGGTSVTAIAAVFASKIQVDATSGMDPAPYTAASVAGVLTVTATNNDSAGLVGVGFTTSSAGTLVVAAATGTISEGEPQDLIDRGVDASLINLASYDTVRIQYAPLVPFSDIDAAVPRLREIYWYGTPGEGAAFAALINAL